MSHDARLEHTPDDTLQAVPAHNTHTFTPKTNIEVIHLLECFVIVWGVFDFPNTTLERYYQ